MASYSSTRLPGQNKGLVSPLNIIVEGVGGAGDVEDEGIDLDSPSSTSSAQDSIGSSGHLTQLPNGDAFSRTHSSSSLGETAHSLGHIMPKPKSSKFVDENRTLRFVGRRGLAIGDGEDIKSAKGTVRGVKNRVRAGIANFEFHPLHEESRMFEEDIGKIVVYTTSMRIVRQTFEDCQLARKIFQNHRVRYEEKDLFITAEFHDDLISRLGEGHPVTLPIVFIDGELIGDVERLEKLNESGELRKILERFEKYTPTSNCDVCGGFRFTPCKSCSGSKKSSKRNDFTDQFHSLKCTQCDENGLMKCPDCNK